MTDSAHKVMSKAPMLKEFDRLQMQLDRLLANKGSPRVLEAGCGSISHVNLGEDAYIVGLDRSEEQLRRNKHIQEAVLADIDTFDFPPEAYDVVVCWNVLEHLSDPDRALDEFVKTVKPGGLIVLACPNALSLRGLVTKFTPYKVHVWSRRYLVTGGKDRDAQAGQDHDDHDHEHEHRHGPFPTVLKFSLSPRGMKRFAAEKGLAIEHFGTYEAPMQITLKKRHPSVGALWKVVRGVTMRLSRDELDLDLSDFIVVMRKPAPGPAA